MVAVKRSQKQSQEQSQEGCRGDTSEPARNPCGGLAKAPTVTRFEVILAPSAYWISAGSYKTYSKQSVLHARHAHTAIHPEGTARGRSPTQRGTMLHAPHTPHFLDVPGQWTLPPSAPGLGCTGLRAGLHSSTDGLRQRARQRPSPCHKACHGSNHRDAPCASPDASCSPATIPCSRAPECRRCRTRPGLRPLARCICAPGAGCGHTPPNRARRAGPGPVAAPRD